jgi:hypothetical protein
MTSWGAAMISSIEFGVLVVLLVLGACVGGGEWALGGPVPIPLMGFTGGMLVLIRMSTYLDIVFGFFEGFLGEEDK